MQHTLNSLLSLGVKQDFTKKIEEMYNANEQILEDKGKDFYRFSYETCTSTGPALKNCKNSQNTLEGLGDGEWHHDEHEEVCKHA